MITHLIMTGCMVYLGLCAYRYFTVKQPRAGDMWVQQIQSAGNTATAPQAPATFLWVQRNGMPLQIPIAQARIGDLVLIGAGEIPPVSGIIVQGIAWVTSNGVSDPAAALVKKAGCRIYTTDLVLAGQIGVLLE